MADHEMISTIADVLPPGASSVAKIGIAGLDALSKGVDDAQNRFNNLLATVQQINDIVKQINNSGPSADNQFVASARALAEANAQGHGLAADLQSNSALQAAAREQLNTSGDAGQRTKREVTLRQSELSHANEILKGYGSDADIIKNKQTADAVANKDEGIILEHDDLQQRIAEAKSQANADAKTHDLNMAAFNRDWGIIDDLTRQAANQDTGYQAAKLRLPGEETNRAQADKVWSDLEGAKNQVIQLQNALAAAQQRLNEPNTSPTSQIPVINNQFATDWKTLMAQVKQNVVTTSGVAASIQTLQQSLQTYYQNIMDELKQMNAEIKQSTGEIWTEIQTMQSQHSNHGP
ncbi:MAG TPA: hypothetical protein VGI03_14555 [Verrucomicrobiae bacterium]|jgi:hypothetical protein